MSCVEYSDDEVVSSDDDQLILVDPKDEMTGTMRKSECHLNSGHLHRAFSIFILNNLGDVLLQKRSSQKMLWPGCWSNACCSHPRVGELDEVAARRRLEQELGIKTRLGFLYKFIYKEEYKDVGVEHEMCSVWLGRAESSEIVANRNEISDWRFFNAEELAHDLKSSADEYTPWMKMEWSRIISDFSDQCGPLS